MTKANKTNGGFSFVGVVPDDCSGALSDGGSTVAVAVLGCTVDSYQADLATCTTSLSSTQSQLTSCTTDKNTCTTNLTTCQTDLAACEEDLVVFPGDGVTGPVLSYTDNGDGTFTDDNTGLVWEKKDTVVGSIHNVGNMYQWSSTGTAADGDLFTTFLATLNTVPCFTGHCDWRIPNVKELQSLVDYSKPFPGPVVDPTLPGDTAASLYWSSTSNAAFPNNAWVVYFNYGFVGFDIKNFTGHARAVRGAQ